VIQYARKSQRSLRLNVSYQTNTPKIMFTYEFLEKISHVLKYSLKLSVKQEKGKRHWLTNVLK